MKINTIQARFMVERFFSKIFEFFFYLIRSLFGLVEFVLFLRLLLKFLGANTRALVVSLLYQCSDMLVLPFDFIFRDIYWKGHLIEIAVVSAIIGYAVLISILFWLLRLLPRD